MSREEFRRANIENLVALWTACGTRDHSCQGRSVLHSSLDWPSRMWFDYDHQPSREDLEQLLSLAERADPATMIPQWHQSDKLMREAFFAGGFAVSLVQEMMVAAMADTEAHPTGDLPLRPVESAESISEWTAIASKSFGYYVHEPVVAKLTGVAGCHLFLAGADAAAVGIGLLLQTDAVAGLHMVGVAPAHRRRGHARQIMFGLLAHARELGCEHATLQASAAGEPLYRQFGFTAQGTLRSYGKTPGSA